MKKMIFSLLLTVTAFSTNSLFAMDSESDYAWNAYLGTKPSRPYKDYNKIFYTPIPNPRDFLLQVDNNIYYVNPLYVVENTKEDIFISLDNHDSVWSLDKLYWERIRGTIPDRVEYGEYHNDEPCVHFYAGGHIYLDQDKSKMKNTSFCADPDTDSKIVTTKHYFSSGNGQKTLSTKRITSEPLSALYILGLKE